MRDPQQIWQYVLDNKLYDGNLAAADKNAVQNFACVCEQLKSDESVLLPIYSFSVYTDNDKPVTIGTTAVIFTNKRLIYGKKKTGFLSQGGLKIVDLSIVNDVAKKDKLFGSISDSHKIIVDTIREQISFSFVSKEDYERVFPMVVDVLDNYKQNASNAQNSGGNTVSAADELKKFKELLDMGIITQEEFDVKKKQLLGL